MNTDILIIIFVVVGTIAAGVYFLTRWASKKQVGQQQLIDKTKQRMDIYVIDKRRDKAENVTLPKAVSENLPKMSKLMKMYFIKCKVGPQVITMMCDKQVYGFIEPKKTYKAEVAGIYIVSVKGMKSKFELKEAAKAKKLKDKEEKAAKKVKAS